MIKYDNLFPEFNEDVSRVILLRHFESIKNTSNIHGGSGDILTDWGRKQAIPICDKLTNLEINKGTVSLFHSNSVQIRESAQIIANNFDIKPVETSLLSSINLGRLNGISDADALEQFPKDYELMEQWRKREIEIDALRPIGMEAPELFWGRGVKFLSLLNCFNNIVICSTSTMILLSHILCGNSYLPGHGYCHIPIKNAQVVSFDFSRRMPHLDSKNTDKELLEYLL